MITIDDYYDYDKLFIGCLLHAALPAIPNKVLVHQERGCMMKL